MLPEALDLLDFEIREFPEVEFLGALLIVPLPLTAEPLAEDCTDGLSPLVMRPEIRLTRDPESSVSRLRELLLRTTSLEEG